jgi:hypothetical protein
MANYNGCEQVTWPILRRYLASSWRAEEESEKFSNRVPRLEMCKVIPPLRHTSLAWCSVKYSDRSTVYLPWPASAEV